MRSSVSVLSLMLVLVAACGTSTTPVMVSPGEAARGSSSVVADLDTNVRACDDFYRFANGGFLAANPVPAAFSRWGRFDMLSQHNREILHRMLDDAAAARTKTSDGDVRRIGELYASCMDEGKVARNGLQPIAPFLARVDALHSPAEIEPLIAYLHAHGIASPLFRLVSWSDPHDATRVMAGLVQAGTGLPDRNYYFETDDKSAAIREQYLQHIATILTLGGSSPQQAAGDATAAMKFETALAQQAMTRADRRDPAALDHPMTVGELGKLAPHFDWPDYFRTLGAPGFARINVAQPKFIEAADRQIESASLEEWQAYLRWQVLNSVAGLLTPELENANFHFYGNVLAGRQEDYPRWRRCVDAVDGPLGDIMGRLYVERNFPPSAKARAMAMIDNLLAALREQIPTLAWMSPETQAKALEKLGRYHVEIGYPSKWRDFSKLEIGDGPYVVSVLNARVFGTHRDLEKIDQPRDRTEWELNPYEVNAYNSPDLNQITFPAGILQPPFFDPNSDDGYNYGGMGAVIGHEIIHGFDDEGRLYDASGNLHDWWTPGDAKEFDTRAACVSDQFSAFTVGDVHVNGKLVLGESIADLGGLTIAYAAYEKSLAGKSRTSIDGFTPEQRFFVGWARIWASNATAESDRLQTTTNEHPLSAFRVNGPTSNMPEFAAAFGCAKGTTMVRASKCSVW